jgi:hypothetical protein
MTAEPPVYSYRSSRLADASARVAEEASGKGKEPSPVAEVTNKVFKVLVWVVLGVALLIWAVVGAIFWVPLMIRALLRFSMSLAESMFEGHKPVRAAKTLLDAVNFYRRGFIVAIELVTREQISEDEEGPVKERRLLTELLWAVFVWYFIFLMFGAIQTSPLDLLDWFLSIPWAEHLRDLWTGLTAGRL